MVFERLKIGFTIVRQSGSVLRDHPKLAVFPLMAGITSLGFLGVLWFSVFSMEGDPSTTTYAGLFGYYLGTTFISSFCMAGLIYCSRQVFRGGTPTVGAGLRAAARNVGPLLVWSVAAAVVGVVIRVLEGNDTVLSEIAAAIFSVAWTVMTFFVVPVLVFEEVGALEMFSRSKDTVVETWGESLGAVGSIGVVTIVLGLLGAIPGVLILWLVPESAGLLGFLALVVSVLFAILIGQALTGITKTALYLYATGEEIPSYFEGIDFSGGSDRSGSHRHHDRIRGAGGIVQNRF